LLPDIANNTLEEEKFLLYLSKFLFSRIGGKYQRNFRFKGNLTCGVPAPAITIASIDFKFTKFSSPYEWIPGMDNAKRIAAEAGFEGFVTVWSEMFAAWVTDKVISQEVVRNLVLALVCVMGMTALLIAEPQTCLWILLCVLLTLLDVCGFMYYWNLTVDIVSCIGKRGLEKFAGRLSFGGRRKVPSKQLLV
jgi:Niemann-Pick C1 protein